MSGPIQPLSGWKQPLGYYWVIIGWVYCVQYLLGLRVNLIYTIHGCPGKVEDEYEPCMAALPGPYLGWVGGKAWQFSSCTSVMIGEPAQTHICENAASHTLTAHRKWLEQRRHNMKAILQKYNPKNVFSCLRLQQYQLNDQRFYFSISST